MRRINFRQGKYIFPAVVFLPLCYIVYYVASLIGGGEETQQVATDRINPDLPEANSRDIGNKLAEMQGRFDDDEAYTAVGALGEEASEKERLEGTYSEEELNRIDAEEAERIRQQKEMENLRRSLEESRKHINTSGSGGYGNSGFQNDYDDEEEYVRQMEQMQQRSMMRQRMLEERLGLNSEEKEQREQQRRQDSIARAKEIERERNRPMLVLKSKDSNSEKFNSVSNASESVDAPLIRAMIDQTTKAHEGTRIRFKLLDNVSIKDIHLPRGTYLYGTVTGFGQQRVKANITSILVGNKFIKVDLSVFDNDGMEGFYVPSSAFRDFVKEAGSRAVQQNMQFDNSGGGYGGISGEAVALQALQNIYNSATTAVSANIRKNRAKIKYNTIVYLINSQEAR